MDELSKGGLENSRKLGVKIPNILTDQLINPRTVEQLHSGIN